VPKAKPVARRQLAVRIPVDLYRRLKVYAARTDTQVLAVVEAALRAYLGRAK
jgi:predicted transcriptional regulator